MSSSLSFDLDPWSIGLSGVDVDELERRESVFALSNGHLGWRGILDEGDPCGIPGSYLNGVFERFPMPYAEEGYGYPETGESVVNVPDGKVIRLLVDDEPFDVRRGELHRHEQRLDFRAGTLHREVEWTSPAGRRVRIESTRLVSFEHRSIGAVRYVVEPIDSAATVAVQSEVVANIDLLDVHHDPRVKAVLEDPLEPIAHDAIGTRATLVHRTRRSELAIAVSMDHLVDAPTEADVRVEVAEDLARTTITSRLDPGERLDVLKLVGHEWSASLSTSALRDRADAAVADAVHAGWEDLVAGQRARLDDYWSCADVVIEGDLRLQQAVRFALFHVFQAAARLEVRSIPGKGLTGAGYQGHAFWDSEAFVLPVLTYTAPDAARQALLWRRATLDVARERAEHLGLEGAAFPWRTIDGRECSGYWPASTAAFHVSADIAAAAALHARVTGDERFERECGLPILVQTARLWMSLGHHDDRGVFHLDGVTGPDEYSAVVDDNVYTNLMAQRNLRAAAEAARRHPAAARAEHVDDSEIGRWTATADAVAVPFDERLGVHEQSAGFTRRERWDFEGTAREQYPLQDHFPYFDLYRKQVVKQADLVLALLVAHDAFTPDEKARAFAYYEELTVRDSSLSAAVQAVIAAEVGHLDLAVDYLAEVATLDLDDLRDDTAEGLHLASLAGIWIALAAGFGGMRDAADGLSFAPRLAPPMTRMVFGVKVAGHTLRLDVRPEATTYRLASGPAIRVRHFGEVVVLVPGEATTMATPPPIDAGRRPVQPRWRRPRPARTALESASD
ncbi:family 65 glycosyl hydrolase [Agromyces sp. CFH 90414]|uniref:Family 65 glycosyl hydrolase n=1 Tax=Agromyces agglutinans TaxID=2662258 RepID=A0A6I2F4U4_9MICO|nr:glycosyl hydrolase family 65 protein [Agromyces agglutinans]MRG58757.1 family 65 glycosyl hydrolase [Agromyces agglutinans]